MVFLAVTIPAGLANGQPVQATAPCGRVFLVQPPAAFNAGQTLTIEIPDLSGRPVFTGPATVSRASPVDIAAALKTAKEMGSLILGMKICMVWMFWHLAVVFLKKILDGRQVTEIQEFDFWEVLLRDGHPL